MQTIMTYQPATSLCQFVVCSDVEQRVAVLQCRILSADDVSWGELCNLAVFEAYRRQGVATALVQTALKMLFYSIREDTHPTGLPKLDRLLASVDHRYVGASHVFEACGFTLVESTPQSALYEMKSEDYYATLPLH